MLLVVPAEKWQQTLLWARIQGQQSKEASVLRWAGRRVEKWPTAGQGFSLQALLLSQPGALWWGCPPLHTADL